METYLRRKGLFQRHLKSDILAEFTKELDVTFLRNGLSRSRP
jgi:hypothetical protein